MHLLFISYVDLFFLHLLFEYKLQLWTPNSTGGMWAFNWRRQLFVSENTLLLQLLGALDGFVCRNDEDRWRWRLEDVLMYMNCVIAAKGSA